MNTSARFSNSANWLQTVKQEGFYFRQVGIFVIAIGFYLHLTRLFVGDTILIGYILTPLFDQLFAIPMAYAGMAGMSKAIIANPKNGIRSWMLIKSTVRL